MENTTSSKIGETPHIVKKRPNTRSSYSSGDSGYITITPNSANSTTAHTPILNSSCRLRSGCSSNGGGSASIGKRRHPRVRGTGEPLKSERGSRLRSKLNSRFEASEAADFSGSSSTGIETARDYVIKTVQKNQSLSSELEGLLRTHNANDEQLITSVPKTPATLLQLLSPPPSPAIPSLSFVASEPIEEDVEMKLVIAPQSTPHFLPPAPADSSPKSSRTDDDTPVYNSLENHSKLSKLMITDIGMSDIRPKRLDFSQRPKYGGLRRARAIPDQAGKGNVDFMRILGEESDHWRIVAKILSHLSSQDLCSVSMVSKAWRRICAKDSRANMRRSDYVILRQNVKENLKLIQAKAKANGDLLASPKSRYARRGLLMEVQNLVQAAGHPLTPSSPPVSPSKVKFHSFLKASRTLEPTGYLLSCPQCGFACQVNGETNVASCSRQGCSMEFCICCSSRHTGPCKTALLATPTKRNKRLIAGSRQSKRNLRRL